MEKKKSRIGPPGMNPDPDGVDEEMDAVEAASSLLHTNSFLPDPDPAVICPDNLILALYDEGARRLIGVDHGPRTMYKLPNLNFETALAFTTAAGGRMLLAYQIGAGGTHRDATPRPTRTLWSYACRSSSTS